MKTKSPLRNRAFGLMLLLAVVPLGLAGCAGSDSEESGSITIPIQDVQSQLGYSDSAGTNTVNRPTNDEDDPATPLAKSVVIGAIVVRSRTLAEGAYNDRTPITDLESQLEDDIRDSAQFITLVNLPSDEEEITVELPPAAATKWQLIGAAFGTQPATKEALGDDETQKATNYIGFDPRFLATNPDGQVVVLDDDGVPGSEPVTDLILNMRRACLINDISPPKGCAQYDPNTGKLVVTSAVEIIDVEVDGVSVAPIAGGGYPIFVTDAASAETAQFRLDGFFEQAKTIGVEVFTTHQLSAQQENPACKTSTTVAKLETNCGVESYFTPIPTN